MAASLNFLYGTPLLLVSCWLLLWMELAEPGVGVLNDAPLAKVLDHLVAVDGHRAVLDVELLEAPAMVGNKLDSLICDHLAALDAELLEVRASLGKHLEACVSYVTLANVQ